MSEITQEITAYPGTVLLKRDTAPETFDAAADTLVSYLVNMGTEVNTFAGQVNTVASEVSANALDAESAKDTALASANFVGPWSALTGALSVPASVSHDGMAWLLLNDLADVTASEPSAGNTDWMVLNAGVSIADKTAAHAITATELAAGNIIFDNVGASGDIEFTLPERIENIRAGFLVAAAHYLKVTAPTGDTISYKGQSSAAAGYVRSNEIGTYWEIVGSATVGYTISKLTGTISVDE